MATSNYPESGIKLVADTGDYKSAMQEAIDLANQFDSVGTLTIDVNADVSEAQSALEDLPLSDETVDYTVNVDQTGDDINDVTSLEDETVTETIDVEKTDESDKALSALETLKNLKLIETVWNIAGTAVDVISKFSEFSLTPMLDLEDAVARVNAQTGNAIPNARTLIKDIFYDDLGESITQVSDMVIEAHNLKLPIDDAVRSALEFTHTFSDQNPHQVLQTIDQMLQAHLAPDTKTAGDMLVTAFQNGANKGGDLLNAIEKNATAISGLGLSGPQALSFIKTGLDNGYTSAEQVLQSLEKIKQNVTNAAGNATSDVSKTLKLLGIANPAETGEEWSADFFKKVIDGIKNQPGLSDSEREVLFTNLIGGKQGGKTFSAFMKMSPDDAAAIFTNVKGASATAATEIDDSLRGAIDDFMLAAQSAAEDFLSSEQLDLPGKIDALKTGLQDGLDVLANGGTLSDALTIALKPVGLDAIFQDLESTMGNFIISILQVVSQLQSLSPDSWEAKKGTDATIAKMGAQQLHFDLKIANPDQIAVDIQTATSRGLSDAQIATSISTVISELIKTGTKDSLAQAQLLVDTLSKPVDQNTLPTLASGAPMNVQPVVSPEALAELQKQIKDATPEAVIPPAVDPTIDKLTQQFGTLTPSTDALAGSANNAKTPLTQQAAATDAVTVAAKPATSAIQTQADATKAMGDGAAKVAKPVKDAGNEMGTASNSINAFKGAVLGMVGALDTVTGKIQAFNNAAGTASNNTSGKTQIDQHASGTDDAFGTFMVGEDGPEIVTSNQHLAVLNNSTTRGIMAALQSFIPSSSGSGSGSGSKITVNNNNFVQSEAQADSVGYSTAKVLRGTY